MVKSRFGWLAGAVLAMGAVLCFGQEAPADRTADHEALRALRVQATEAMNKRDLTALRDCFAKEFVFTGVDQTVITDEAGLKAYDTRTFDGPDALLKSITVAPEAAVLTRFLGDDVGYCYGVSNDAYTLKSGKVVKMDSAWTAVVVREDGHWKIAAAHAGADLLKNPVLDGVKSFGYKVGGGALLLGLLLGFVAGRMGGRRR